MVQSQQPYLFSFDDETVIGSRSEGALEKLRLTAL
jgi:hypothetical protein